MSSPPPPGNKALLIKGLLTTIVRSLGLDPRDVVQKKDFPSMIWSENMHGWFLAFFRWHWGMQNNYNR